MTTCMAGSAEIDIEAFRSKLWAFLKENALGRDNAITSAELLTRFGIDKFRLFRAIHELNTIDHRPVVSAEKGEHKGIFVAVSREDLRECAGRMERRISGIRERMTALEDMANNFDSLNPAQALMF